MAISPPIWWRFDDVMARIVVVQHFWLPGRRFAPKFPPVRGRPETRDPTPAP